MSKVKINPDLRKKIFELVKAFAKEKDLDDEASSLVATVGYSFVEMALMGRATKQGIRDIIESSILHITKKEK